MSRLPTLEELFQEIHTRKRDKLQWVNTRLETTYVSTYNFSFQYFKFIIFIII